MSSIFPPARRTSAIDRAQVSRVEQIRQILSARGLTLYRLSGLSAEIFGRSSRYHIPHNLYYDVADPSQGPHIEQVLAFSHITGYRLADWLAVFGISLERISALQLSLPTRRTILLDSTVYDTQAWIPWFFDRVRSTEIGATAPLAQLLGFGEPRRAAQLLALRKRKFLYGKIGETDIYSSPEVVPGTIVRIDTDLPYQLPLGAPEDGKRLFFIEYGSGWACAELVRVSKELVMVKSREGPGAVTNLAVGKNARVLGVVDAEIRPLKAAARAGGLLTPGSLNPSFDGGSITNLKDLLRSSRSRVGLSFREASAASRLIATALSDERFFAAISTLSDYETLLEPPRRIQKIFTLCVVYSIDFYHFLARAGLPLELVGREPIPDELLGREAPASERGPSASAREGSLSAEGGGFLNALMESWEDAPLFLRHSLPVITGLKTLSLRDLFWVGGQSEAVHPWLINATLVAVNRRRKKPDRDSGQSLYIILRRDGSYLCAPCSLRQGLLTVHASPAASGRAQQFRNGTDAEVIGQVTAILRRLEPKNRPPRERPPSPPAPFFLP